MKKKQVVEQYTQYLLVENKSGRFGPKSLGIRGIHSSDRTKSCFKLQVIRLSVSQRAHHRGNYKHAATFHPPPLSPAPNHDLKSLFFPVGKQAGMMPA